MKRFARFGAHAPEICRLIVVRGGHAGVEADVTLEVEAVGDVVEVAQDLRRPGIALRPFPLARQLFGERVTVGVAFRIASRTGVAVPVPGAADPRARLQHLDRKTQTVAQAEQLIETGKTGADDQRVEGALGGFAFRSFCDGACRCHPILNAIISGQDVLSRSGGGWRSAAPGLSAFRLLVSLLFATLSLATLKGGDPVRSNQGSTGRQHSGTGSMTSFRGLACN